jgi:hypothetical protein
MVLYRQDSVERQGLVYDEMRRLGKEHFYIELIENYPCNNKGELESRLHFFIKERSTLNSKTKQDTSTDAPEQSYTTNHMLEIKEMMRDLHTRICKIECKIDVLLNNSCSSVSSAQSSHYEQQLSEMDASNNEQEVIEAYSNEHQSIETDSNEHKSIETYSNEHKSIETDSNEYKSTETHSNEHKDIEADSNEHKSIDTHSNEHKSIETDSNEYKSTETHSNEHKDKEAHKSIDTHSNEHKSIEIELETTINELTPLPLPPPLTPSIPEVFQISDSEDVEEVKPTNIQTYDLTEKEFQLFKHKIPDEVLEKLEKLRSITLSAEAERAEHPNDEERIEFHELSLQNSFNMIEEVEEHFEFYKGQNPNDETTVECDTLLLKWKIVMAWQMGLVPAHTITSICEGKLQHNNNNKKKNNKNAKKKNKNHHNR